VNFIKTHWVVKNVPPFINEPYIFCQDDYKGKINFQLDGFPDRYLRLNSVNNMGNNRWKNIVNYFYYRGGFGNLLLNNTKWFSNSEVKTLYEDTSKSLDHAKSIFYFVQNRFNKTGNTFGPIHNNDEVFKLKQGNETEINLFLTSLLLKAGFDAVPVLLSTRSNGIINYAFPDANKINYCIVRLLLNDHFYYLDASDKQLGFGKIPLYCYNGIGMVLDSRYSKAEFDPDKILLSNIVSANLEFGKNNEFNLRVHFNPDYSISTEIRGFTKQDSILPNSIFEALKTSLNPFILDSLTIKDKELKESPIILEYTAHIPKNQDSFIYINPLLNARLLRNPFSTIERHNPVNLPGSIRDYCVLDLEIPKAYKIEELPKPKIYSINPDVNFNYEVKQVENHIQVRYNLSIQQNYFLPEEYDKLRLFYDEILKKANEFIVLKKI